MARRKRSEAVEKKDLSHLPIDIIIRVSDLAGRDPNSESYHTESDQEKEARAIIVKKGRQVGEVLVERDIPGDWERDILNNALRRIDQGESGGIAVGYFSRFARTAGQALISIDDINKKGAIFISGDGEYDTTTTMGRAFAGILAVLAQMERERIRENWRRIVSNNVEFGRYAAGAVPFGYLLGKDKRLFPNPKTAPIAEHIFGMRADGMSWNKICNWLDEQAAADPEIRPPAASLKGRIEKRGEWKSWTRQTVAGIIANPVYKGVIQQQGESHDFINEAAHEAIVDADLWALAQSEGADGRSERDGKLARQCLGKGFVVCENCGHKLIIRGRTYKGSRLAFYTCNRRYATGWCEHPANIDAKKLDPFLEGEFLEYVGRFVSAKRVIKQDDAKLEKLRADLAKADRSLIRWIEQEEEYIEDLGDTAEARSEYRAELKKRRHRRDEARMDVERAESRKQVLSEIVSGHLLERWDEASIDQKRGVLTDSIERVEIKCANGRTGRAAPPVEERVVIHWAQSLR